MTASYSAPLKDLGLISGRFRIDPYKNFMAVSIYSRFQKVEIWLQHDLCWFCCTILCWDERRVFFVLFMFLASSVNWGVHFCGCPDNKSATIWGL